MNRQDENAARRRLPVIAIGGMDRAGKSTQIDEVLKRLAVLGYEPVARWNRVGYTPRIESLKRFLRRLRGLARRRKAADACRTGEDAPRHYPERASQFGSAWRRRLWLTAALLDLLWETAVSLRWLRAGGRAVVCDRWLCDALVDLRVNFPNDAVEKRLLWRMIQRFALRPDASVLLLISPEESLRRSQASGRRHVEPPEVLAARLAEYRRIAAEGLGEVIDAERPPEAISDELRDRLDAIIKPGGPSHC